MPKKKVIFNPEFREKVIEAASRAFVRDGVKRVRMDDIASDLSISKRTIYEIFGDKEEVLLNVIKAHRQQIKTFMAKKETESENILDTILAFYEKSIQDLRDTNVSFFQDIQKYPKVVEYLDNERRMDIETSMQYFVLGVKQGIFREDCNYQIVQSSLAYLRDFLFRDDLNGNAPFLEIYETILFVYMRGISTEKGVRIVDEFLKKRKEMKRSI